MTARFPIPCPGLFRAVVLAATVSGSCPAALFSPTPLVDIDFNELAPGEVPTFSGIGVTTLPNDRLVSNRFGMVVGAGGVPGMNRPLEMLPMPVSPTSSLSYSQVVVFDETNSPDVADTYHFSMDFLLSGFETRAPEFTRSVDQFSIILDFPSVRRLDFTTDGSTGQISYNNTPVYVGNFSFDEAHHLDILFDIPGGSWSAWLDSRLLFEDATFFRPFDLQRLDGLRINLRDDVELAGVSSAYIDNLRLVAAPDFIPEPAVGIYGLAAAAGLLGRRRRARSSRGGD